MCARLLDRRYAVVLHPLAIVEGSDESLLRLARAHGNHTGHLGRDRKVERLDCDGATRRVEHAHTHSGRRRGALVKVEGDLGRLERLAAPRSQADEQCTDELEPLAALVLDDAIGERVVAQHTPRRRG